MPSPPYCYRSVLAVSNDILTQHALTSILADHYLLTFLEDPYSLEFKIKQWDYDLVILDMYTLLLPWRVLLKKLKEQYPSTIIIILSNEVSSQELTEVLGMGVYHYLIQHIEPHSLLEMFQHAFQARDMVAKSSHVFSDSHRE